MDKKTGSLLKTGVKVAGLAGSVGLCFTGVGTAAGLTGVSALGADLVGGVVADKAIDATTKTAAKAIDKHTDKDNDKDKKNNQAKPKTAKPKAKINRRGQSLDKTKQQFDANVQNVASQSQPNFANELANLFPAMTANKPKTATQDDVPSM